MSDPDPNTTLTDEGVTTPLPVALPPNPPGYQLIERLGSGGTGTVYRAQDQQTGATVALKYLRFSEDNQARARFRREFLQLQEHPHPHIVTVYQYGEEFNQPYFVMEYLAGSTLIDWLAEFTDPPLSQANLLPIFLQIVETIDYLHSCGITHRDLKPGNIMVIAGAAAGQAPQIKLLDFGLVRLPLSSQQLTQSGAVLGTFAYMAPEQFYAADDVDARADLYAIGVMLYEAFTQRLPFTGHDIQTFFYQHTQAAPRPPSELVATVSSELEAIILRLLAKEPADRYASAGELLAVLAELSGQPLSGDPEQLDRQQPLLYQARLVSRQPELARLQERFGLARQGVPQVVLVEGEAGVGKTRLIKEFLQQLPPQAATILSTTVARTSGSAFAPLLAILQAGLEKLKRAKVKWSAEFWPLADLLGELAPLLIQQQITRPPALPPEQERTRFFASVVRFVQLLARPRPLLVFLDDLHWADADTLQLLYFLYTRAEQAQLPLLLCATYRHDAIDLNPAFVTFLTDLRRNPAITGLTLARLCAAEVEIMVSKMLRQSLPELAQQLFAKTDGNALFIDTTLRALIDQQELLRRQGVWHWLGRELTLPASVTDLFQQRLNLLSPASRHLLRYAALIEPGPELNYELLLELQEESEGQLLALLTEWVRLGLTRTVRQGDGYIFAHAIVRDVARRGPGSHHYHRHIAQSMERCYAAALDQHAGALAYHYRQAAQPARALAFALRAACYADQRYAYINGLQILRAARRDLRPTTPVADRIAFYTGWGDACDRLGQHHKAAQAYTIAFGWLSQRLPDPPTGQIADLARQIGRQYGWTGQMATALTWMERGRQLVEQDPEQQTTLALIEIHTAFLFFQQADYHRVVECCQRALSLISAAEAPAIQAEGYLLLGSASDCLSQFAQALEAYQRSISLWRQLNNRYQVARAENNLAGTYDNLGQWAQARELYSRVLHFFRQVVGDAHRSAVTLSNLGLVDYNQGDYATALERQLEARRYAQPANVPWLNAHILVNLAWVYCAQQRWDEATASATASAQLQEQHKIAASLTEAYRILAYVAAGRGQWVLAETTAQQALALAQRQDNPAEEAAAARLLGKILRLQGDFAGAAQHLLHSLTLCQTQAKRLEIARTCRQLAWLHRDLGDGAQSLHYACHALTLLVQLGAWGEATRMVAAEKLQLTLLQDLAGAVALCRAQMQEAGWSTSALARPLTQTDLAQLQYADGQATLQIRLRAEPPAIVVTFALQ